jgi:hypothetical protein
MENSVLTHLLLQASVGEILGRAERDRLASKAVPSAPGVAALARSCLRRIRCSRRRLTGWNVIASS